MIRFFLIGIIVYGVVALFSGPFGAREAFVSETRLQAETATPDPHSGTTPTALAWAKETRHIGTLVVELSTADANLSRGQRNAKAGKVRRLVVLIDAPETEPANEPCGECVHGHLSELASFGPKELPRLGNLWIWSPEMIGSQG
ncbi:hypothetical protein ACWGS9_23605 [Bradyrhizobium sp. Arg314]